ncbi:cytochrome P450 [Pseudoclavibacter sp. AY1F1]|uniref:cytochrome P450 n=1 Tax=Pseudoclavibacter sp. AY1F1 TaxID=2080583 RepID=UPI000CE7AD1E|nr:cytochrome P450 [Pseudoclavibacter sp. AY1F1]PPF44419.1 cytochrome P450 [Pseudoclavibacter sp. AY1F1]
MSDSTALATEDRAARDHTTGDSSSPGWQAVLDDDTLSLMTRGYGFGSHIWSRARAQARAVPLRLLGRKAMLVRGSDAVRLFYDEDSIARHGAMPAFVQESLFGHGSVHSLDGPEHRHRKASFLRVAYDDDRVEELVPHLEREWRAQVEAWVGGNGASAYDAAVAAFGRASMTWAGLPGTAAAKSRWAVRLAQIVDGFGVPYSPEFLLAFGNRMWSDRHAARLVEAARAGTIPARAGTALHEWAWHVDERGELLSPQLAGIELQNSIRPMIAVARFVAFAAKELHERPDWQRRIGEEAAARGTLHGGPLATAFAQEVRRTAPFVPTLPGWARHDIEFDGARVPAGGRLLLDILGTNTDDSSWDEAGSFLPQRFLGVDDYEALEEFIPHGGADVADGHRCPGEKLAIAGLATAIAALSDLRLDISGIGLEVNRRRLPTKPSSGGLIRPAASASRTRSETASSRCPVH